MTKKIILLVLMVIVSNFLHAQKNNLFFNNEKANVPPKLYLHTDRDFFFIGDTIWIAAYLLDGQTHLATTGKNNLYLNLVNQQGKVVSNSLFLLENGYCAASLALADTSINAGNYFLRACTRNDKDVSEEEVFTKIIRIAKVKNYPEFIVRKQSEQPDSSINVSFFPEGGFLLANQINTLAFKATDHSGKGIPITGKLIEEDGKELYSFHTEYDGMGRIYFIPRKGVTYKVQLDDLPDLDPKIPEIKSTGSKILVNKCTRQKVNFTILSKEKRPQNFYLVVMHRGKGIYFLDVESNMPGKILTIPTSLLKQGINRLILLNDQYKPLSERLVFIDKNEDIDLSLETNKSEFSTRENVKVKIANGKALKKNETAQVSVAVIDENIFNTSGIQQNIKSYLILDSELKGSISSPADYFKDEEKLTSNAKLNLLMLTHGWRNYRWSNDMEDKKPDLLMENGLSIIGKVQTLNQKKTVPNAEVTLGIFDQKSYEVYSTKSDSSGVFAFKNIFFSDTSTVFLQGVNHKNKRNTFISYQSPHLIIKQPGPAMFKQLNQFSDIPVSVFRKKYFNDIREKEFLPNPNSRIIKDIDVKAPWIKKPDGHFRMYSEPTQSFQIKEQDYSYPSVIDYMIGRIPRLWLNYSPDPDVPPSLQIGKSGCKVLIDNIPADMYAIDMLSMFDVDKIEVLKGVRATIYGMSGGGGVILIFTKNGNSELSKKEHIKVPGTIVERIKGFAIYREFFSPEYTEKNRYAEKPDYRTTLFWNPGINIVNGEAGFSFYTCDNISRYKILVEGITNKGRTCLGLKTIEVNQRTELSKANTMEKPKELQRSNQ